MKLHQLHLSVLYTTCLISCLTASAFEDNHIADDDSVKTREYDFSIEYGTTRLYRGIKSSSHSYMKPSFMYYSKGGFYTGLAGYVSLYLKAALEETDLNAGYDFSISENTLCTIELTHYIIKNTDLANASIKNNVEVAFRHTFGKTYKIKLYFDNDFGNGQSDFSFTFENSLVYAAENVFKEDSRMLIKPSFSFTAATLNLVRRNQQEAFSRSRFAVTNYDLSLLIEYETGRFIIAQEATYDIPPARKRARLAKPADTTPVFYFTASVTYVID